MIRLTNSLWALLQYFTTPPVPPPSGVLHHTGISPMITLPRSAAIPAFVALWTVMLTSCAKLSPSGAKVAEEGDCLYCHELPPADGAHRKHVNDAGYGCMTCHPGIDSSNGIEGDTYHLNGTIDIVFAAIAGDSATYSAEDHTCANTYCHGSISGGTQSTPAWTETDFVCRSCHGLPPDQGAHTGHDSLDCGICHSGYSALDSTISATRHLDGYNDVDGPIDGGSFDSTAATCSNVGCHSGTRVSWFASGSSCNTCHEAPPRSGAHQTHLVYDCGICHEGYSLIDTAASPATHFNNAVDVDGALDGGSYASGDSSCSGVGCHMETGAQWYDTTASCGLCHATPPATGAHETHGSNDCSVCHAGYSMVDSSTSTVNHVDDTVNVDGPLEGGSYSAADSTCSSVDCHGSAEPNWYGTASTCGSCHALPPTTGAHDTHEARGHDCGICHAGYSMTDSSISTANHDNGATDVDGALDGGTYSPSDTSCSSVGCHGGATVSWNGTTEACGTCHALPPSSGGHATHDAEGYDCGLCHAGSSLSDSSTSSATHNNGGTDVDGAMKGGSYSFNDSTCSGAYCHGSFAGGTNAQPQWFTATIECNTCHALPPATGSHTTHVADQGYDCDSCHSGYTTRTETVNAGNHIDSMVAVDGTLGGGSYSDSTCSGVYCHGAFSGGTQMAPTWGGSTLDCSSCHDGYLSGRHQRHAGRGIDCGECHGGYTSTQADSTNHLNRHIEVDGALGGGSYDSGTGKCANMSCHADKRW